MGNINNVICYTEMDMKEQFNLAIECKKKSDYKIKDINIIEKIVFEEDIKVKEMNNNKTNIDEKKQTIYANVNIQKRKKILIENETEQNVEKTNNNKNNIKVSQDNEKDKYGEEDSEVVNKINDKYNNISTIKDSGAMEQKKKVIIKEIEKKNDDDNKYEIISGRKFIG